MSEGFHITNGKTVVVWKIGFEESGKKKTKKTNQPIGFMFNEPITSGTANFIKVNVENLAVSNQGLSAVELKQLDELFLQLREQVLALLRASPSQVEQPLQDLYRELSKGNNANPDVLNKGRYKPFSSFYGISFQNLSRQVT